ncbi:membrane cofactor protein-like isoform X2 [Enoplosus armatus]|uniref:membrane cofactor protein-like isoform X2 n=1 Tax=Enoplosus armatus TaxID=215367 RepID=UPI00399110A9
MGVSSFLLLSCLGLAITAQAQDCSRPLAGPNMNLKDDDILLQTFPDGLQVSFTCEVGYMSVGGSAVITCMAGTWTPVRLKCERLNCGSAGEVDNGFIDYSGGSEFGDQCEIFCNTGYRLVGNNKLLCEVKGWSGRLPVCEVLVCDPPPVIEGGTFSPNEETYEYGHVVRYSCQSGYTLKGTPSISCSEDGTFVPRPPTCIVVQCEDPDILNADWVKGSRPPHIYRATVTYQCRSGYVMKGASTQTCEGTGQWSPGLPQCEKIKTTTTTTTAKPTEMVTPTKATTTTTTTTTTHSRSTKKPTAAPGPGPQPTDSPDNGSDLSKPLGITFGVIGIGALIAGGLLYCGCPAYIKKKRRKCSSPVGPTLLGVKLTG